MRILTNNATSIPDFLSPQYTLVSPQVSYVVTKKRRHQNNNGVFRFAAGQEQQPASKKPGKQARPRAPPQVADEQPVNFVSHSKFALLAVDDSDEDAE